MTNSDSSSDENEYDFDKSVSEQVAKFIDFAMRLEVHEEDVADTYAAVSDPENYPPDVIKMFEGRPMVPTRLILEKMKQRRNHRPIQK